MRLSYLISSRSDLFLGSFISDPFLYVDNINSQMTINYAIPNWQPTSNEVIFTTQFSGVRTILPKPLHVYMFSKVFDAQDGILTLKLYINTSC
jgi:hypothetical protein